MALIQIQKNSYVAWFDKNKDRDEMVKTLMHELADNKFVGQRGKAVIGHKNYNQKASNCDYYIIIVGYKHGQSVLPHSSCQLIFV